MNNTLSSHNVYKMSEEELVTLTGVFLHTLMPWISRGITARYEETHLPDIFQVLSRTFIAKQWLIKEQEEIIINNDLAYWLTALGASNQVAAFSTYHATNWETTAIYETSIGKIKQYVDGDAIHTFAIGTGKLEEILDLSNHWLRSRLKNKAASVNLPGFTVDLNLWKSIWNEYYGAFYPIETWEDKQDALPKQILEIYHNASNYMEIRCVYQAAPRNENYFGVFDMPRLFWMVFYPSRHSNKNYVNFLPASPKQIYAAVYQALAEFNKTD